MFSNKYTRKQKLSNLPLFHSLLPILISIILTIIPTLFLRPLVRLFTGFQPHSVDTTTAFLKSKHGVHQALYEHLHPYFQFLLLYPVHPLTATRFSYMGADEMRSITANKWDAELWGASHPSPCGMPRPQLFFYFGKNDHWVAERTRDDLIESRGRNGEGDGWKPKMEIDVLGTPHAFPDGKSDWMIASRVSANLFAYSVQHPNRREGQRVC